MLAMIFMFKDKKDFFYMSHVYKSVRPASCFRHTLQFGLSYTKTKPAMKCCKQYNCIIDQIRQKVWQ